MDCKITTWECFNKKKLKYEHNHIVNNWLGNEKPLVVNKLQEKMWKNQQWKKSYDYIVNGKVVEMSNGYSCIGLNNPKFDENIGAVLRAAGCYKSKMVSISGKRYKKNRVDTMAQYRHIPLLHVNNLKEVIPYDCASVAVEFTKNAIALPSYIHPKRGYYIFGAEDETLGNDILSWCRDVICIQTERCMNLAACVNVVLYDRMAKEYRK